jgi:hypothetical protein
MGVFLFLVVVILTIIIYKKFIKNEDQKKEAENDLKARAEQLGNELVKKGYELTYHDIDSVGGGHYQMYVGVYQGSKKMGNMRFGTFGRTSDFGSSVGYSFSLKHISDRYKINSFNHIIHLDKSGTIIESEVPCSEPPPEWMKICGQFLRSAGYTISYPEWMGDHPDASKYVNVVFQ